MQLSTRRRRRTLSHRSSNAKLLLKDNKNVRFAHSSHLLYGRGSHLLGWASGRNLADRNVPDWRDGRLRRIGKLLPSLGQRLCQNRRNPGSSARRVSLFWRVQLCNICSFRLRADANVFRSHRVRDVRNGAVAALRASIPASRVLPLLLVFGSSNIFARRDRGCCPAVAPDTGFLTHFL